MKKKDPNRPVMLKKQQLERLQMQSMGSGKGLTLTAPYRGSRKHCKQCGVPFTGRGKICSTCFEINGNRVLKEKFIL